MPCSFASSFASSFTPCSVAVGDYAGNRDPVSDVVSELYGVALDLPSRAFGCWPIVLARSRSVRSQLR
jgi:hypothetical protein